jgi:hypothetical protein
VPDVSPGVGAMTELIVIHRGSQAFEKLAWAFALDATRTVSLCFREDGLAVKVNDSLWSVGLVTGMCEFPPGCAQDAAPGKRLCHPHYEAVYALLGPKEQS